MKTINVSGKEAHKRRSMRLKEYDYAQPGAYFVTICTQNGACLFGEVQNDEMIANEAGKMIEYWWRELKNKFSSVELDEHIVMPNHLHGIVNIVGAASHVNVGADSPVNVGAVLSANVGAVLSANVGADLCVCPGQGEPKIEGAHIGTPLPRIVQWFKTMTTNGYINNVKNHGWEPFIGKLWQRNYYERIIRDEDELNRIREYIGNNSLRWGLDRENPSPENVVFNE